MTNFRARQWGSSDWTHVSIESDSDDSDVVETAITSIIGSALGTSSLHVQRMEDGEWEDLE